MSKTTSNTLTAGIRVEAWPHYLSEHSDPAKGSFVYGYRIRISNEGQTTLMLVSRHWTIIDSDGHSEEVNGLGVVGEQPVLEPGESFQYESFCPMASNFGTMEGEYHFIDELGESLVAHVGRFYLVAKEEDAEVQSI